MRPAILLSFVPRYLESSFSLVKRTMADFRSALTGLRSTGFPPFLLIKPDLASSIISVALRGSPP